MASLAACSFLVDTESLSDLGNGDGGGGDVDGAGNVGLGDAGAVDDSRAPDAIADSHTEANITVETGASPLPGCAGLRDAGFCEDFDHGDPLGAKWTGIDHTPLGTISLSDASFSAPYAASIDNADAHGCDSLAIQKFFAGTYSQARVQFRVLLRSPSSTAVWTTKSVDGTYYRSLAYLTAGGGINLSLQAYHPDGGVDQIGGAQGTLVAGLLTDHWYDIELTIQATPTRIARLRVDDVEVTATLPVAYAMSNPNLSLGSWCAPSPQEITVDDVAIWVTP